MYILFSSYKEPSPIPKYNMISVRKKTRSTFMNLPTKTKATGMSFYTRVTSINVLVLQIQITTHSKGDGVVQMKQRS